MNAAINPSLETFRFTFALAAYFLTFFGAGHLFAKYLNTEEQSVTARFSIRIAFGMLIYYVLAWTLTVLSLGTNWIAHFMFAVGVIGLIVFLIDRKKYRHQTGFQIYDFLLLILWLPMIISAATTPFTDWDGVMNWNTWARHWAQREQMNDYGFGLYVQFVPVVNSYIYRLTGSAFDILPAETFALHAVWPILGLLVSMLMRRSALIIFKGTKDPSFWSFVFVCSFVLLREVRTAFINGRAEGFSIFFLAVLLHRVLTVGKIVTIEGKVAYKNLLSLASVAAALCVIKLHSAPWALALVGLACFFPFASDNDFKKAFYEVKLGLTKRIRAVVIGSSLTLVPLVFFLIHQRNKWNKLSGDYALNHSPFVSGAYVTEMKQAHDDIIRVMPWIKTEFQTFVGFMLQVFKVEFINAEMLELLQKSTMLAISTALVFIGLKRIWTIPLVLTLLACFYQWWIRLSYAIYNLLPSIYMAAVLAICGASVISKFLANSDFQHSLRAGGLSRYLARAKHLVLAVACTVVFFTQQKKLAALIDKFSAENRSELFVYKDSFERVSMVFPGHGEVVRYVYKLIESEVDHNWRKKLIVTDHPLDRFLPHSFLAQWLTKDLNGKYYEEYENLKKGLYIQVSTQPLEGGTQVGGFWVLDSPILAAQRKSRTAF